MLDQDQVDEAVRFINRQAKLRGAELARVVGGYVLEVFFDGSYAAFRRQSRSKPVSFRSLVRHLDLRFSASKLCTLVRISQQLEELPAATANQLSLSHHRALLPLTNSQEKTQLADAALHDGWSRSRLEREVRKHLPSARVGRKPLSELDRSVRELSAAARTVARLCVGPRLPPAEVAHLADEIDAVRERLAFACVQLRSAADCFPGGN